MRHDQAYADTNKNDRHGTLKQLGQFVGRHASASSVYNISAVIF